MQNAAEENTKWTRENSRFRDDGEELNIFIDVAQTYKSRMLKKDT
jgi:hypothetical protein